MSLLTLPELSIIRRMLRANIRHAEIARRLGMPVETVTLVGTSHKLRRRRLDLLTEDDLPDDYDAPPDYLAANLRRCEDCGGMAYRWPCLACRLRAAQAAGTVLPDEEEDDCIAATSGRGEPLTDEAIERTGDEVNDWFQFSATTGRGYAPSTCNRNHVHA